MGVAVEDGEEARRRFRMGRYRVNRVLRAYRVGLRVGAGGGVRTHPGYPVVVGVRLLRHLQAEEAEEREEEQNGQRAKKRERIALRTRIMRRLGGRRGGPGWVGTGVGRLGSLISEMGVGIKGEIREMGETEGGIGIEVGGR